MSNNFHLQLYRGTTAQNDAYTGLSGEVTVDTTLSKLRLHDGSTKGGVEIGGMPVGSIIPYAGTTIPAGYLLCDGSAISRTTYSALFASIGTTDGAWDGNSTFNIPNLNNRFLEGNGTGYIEAGLPDIQGGIRTNEFGWDPNGAFSIDQRETLNVQGTNSSSTVDWVKFKASTYNSIYGNSNTVQPPACKCYFCIKF